MIIGKCLCGEIKFEIEEIPGKVFNCHCNRCQKSHGAAFATQVLANKESLNFLRGKNKLSEFSFNGMQRSFCSSCGSKLMNYAGEGSDYISISIGAIEGAKNLNPIGEYFVGEKQNFVQLDQSIKHFADLSG